MTLRRRLVFAFVALVAMAVSLVGGISYSATVATVHGEADDSLLSAAGSFLSGTAMPGHRDGDPDDSPAGRPRDVDDLTVSLIQRISPAGVVTPARGPVQALVPTVTDLRLAAGAAPGLGRFGQHRVGVTTFRTYTLALGGGHGAIIVGRNTSDNARVLSRVALNTILIGLGVVLLAALVGWWIARQITRRLGSLSLSAEHVARTGDLTAPIETGGRDEVASLAGSIRTMLAQLAQSRDAQRRLIEDAGHELRTPLTSLRTNAQVMRRFDNLDGKDRVHLLDDVDSELTELTELVNELVELATDTYESEPPQRAVLRRLAERAANRVRRRTGRDILVTADDSEVEVQPSAIERAVGNLLENAIKFDPDGTAPIEVDIAGGTIRVSDRGPGVSLDELDTIFDRFHRSAASRGLPGSGLGLAIVREIAERHGGTATAYARPGGGLTIAISLGDGLLSNSDDS
jgi:two-component system sensor histidine kinase MprB